MNYIADKRLYLNADRTKVVEEGPEASYLLVPEGGSLTDEQAKQYGLTGKKKADAEPEAVPSTAADAAPAAEPEPAPEPDTKAVEKAPENKAQAMPKANKDK